MKYCNSIALDVLQPLPESVTVCATVNEAGDEQMITDWMIRRACKQAEEQQPWPLADAMRHGSAKRSEGPVSARVLPFRPADSFQK